MTARTPRTHCRQVRSSQQAGNIPSINHTLGKFAIHEGCQGALAERLIYDGSHLIAVADRDGAVVTQFLHGPMVDQVLAESHFDSLSGDRTDVSFIASDHLGSVRGLLSWSDSTSSVVSQSWLSYDAYGNELSTSTIDLGAVGHTVTSEVRSRFGYTGRDRDSESDLQYNRARYYDAATGRWISKDPIGFEAGDANLYRYVGNGPTNATDPTGLEQRDDFRRRVMFLVGQGDSTGRIWQHARQSGMFIYGGSGSPIAYDNAWDQQAIIPIHVNGGSAQQVANAILSSVRPGNGWQCFTRSVS